jgi:XTP/dITP diphosphohydrolase
MDIWIGTTNKGKLTEIKLIIEKEIPNVVLHSITELSTYVQPPENGQTYLDNARIKARSLKSMKPGFWVVAEDSGLEVTGLNNFPGIHSARYAGPKAADSENVAKLLKMMQIRNVSPRTARFYCQMVVFTPTGEEWLFDGELKGTIAPKATGVHGFGYDPVFIPDGQPDNNNKTLAELGFAFKNQNSHRASAIRSFVAKLRTSL